jgi:predicted O-methyltransferase YrrM
MDLSPSAHIAPDSFAATSLHRGVMLARLPRARAVPGASGAALAAALRAAALNRISERERAALEPVETRRAEIPGEMVASGKAFGFGPAPGEDGGEAAASPLEETGGAMPLDAAREVCRWSTMPPIWGRFLFHLVRELRPLSCFELGTGLGVSALYTAAALRLNGVGRLTTFDREHAARIGADGFASIGVADRVTLCFGDIDETLPAVGQELAPVEFALLDAEHSAAATIRHFNLVLPYLAEDAVLLFDDITQGEEMRDAWKTVIADRRVGANIALRRYGVVVVSPQNV